MTATNTGYAGVRMTSGTKRGASGKRVNVPLSARTWPSLRYPSWSDHSAFQSGRWYQIKKSPCNAANSATNASERPNIIARDCTRSREELAIERLDVVDKTIETEASHNRFAASGAHRAASCWIGEQGQNGVGEADRVTERSHQADVAARDDISNAADLCAHARHAGRETFDQGDGGAFVPRCQQENISRAVNGSQIAAPPKKSHAVG